MSGWQRKHPKAEHVQKPPRGAFAVRMVDTEASLPKSVKTAAKRASRMSERDLLDYAETSLSGIGRCLDDNSHESPSTGDALREAHVAAGTLYAVLEELVSRAPTPLNTGVPSVAALRRMGTVKPG